MLVKSEVKYIQSLGQKKFRDEENSFVAEGVKLINELLAARNVRAVRLYATQEWISGNDVRDGKIRQVPVIEVSPSELERISFLKTPNRVLGIFGKPVFEQRSDRAGIMLLLDDVQDPGNLGTIIRTADWFNIHKIICAEGSADCFNPKVVQSTMGSIARVPIVHQNLNDAIAQAGSMQVFATTLEGENIFDVQPLAPALVIIGNESKGISPGLLNPAVRRITIPRIGHGESLNVAVAAGIMLSHLTFHAATKR